ncbi:hypothetical protein TNCV_2433091 [Trichonephila clavipes]|nr:hypothetical protein TNCV_2433091 [Trichonephila clavipes]
MPVVSRSFEYHTCDERFGSVPPKFGGRTPGGDQGPPTSLLFLPNSREDLRLLRVPPYLKGIMHLQTSMPSLGCFLIDVGLNLMTHTCDAYLSCYTYLTLIFEIVEAVARASDSKREGLALMPNATKYPPSTRGVRAY